MTGPEHYAAAEALVRKAADARGTSYGRAWLDEAQVHATLAHTAATALTSIKAAEHAGTDSKAAEAWREVMGIGPRPAAPTEYDAARAHE